MEFNAIPSPPDTRDYTFGNIPRSLKLPKTFSLRKHMRWVRNQGMIGSCVAMSAAAVKEYHESKDVNYTNYLSPWYVYVQRSIYPRSGMYLRDALEILRNKGICPESDYMYNTSGGLSPDIHAAAANFKIDRYIRIQTMEELKLSLMEYGPALICVPVYHTSPLDGRIWASSGQQGAQGYHCMTVVGWTKKGFEIRNSWGPTWNIDGHCILPYSDWGVQTEIWAAVDSKSSPVHQPTVWEKILDLLNVCK